METSKRAVWSLVMSILGISGLPVIGSVAALFLGYAAKREIEESGGALEGKGLAQAGIVIGWISLGVLALSLCVFVLIMRSAFGGR